MTHLRWLGVILLVALACGCAGGHGSVRDLAPDSEGESFTLGTDLFTAHNYSEAALQLKSYLDGNPAGIHAEDASYMLGVSYARRGDWPSAQVELRNFVDRYPGSTHLAEVEMELARAYWHDARPPQYDQEKTLFTRDQLNRVLILYPDSPFIPEARKLMQEVRARLAEREIINARLYAKLNQPQGMALHAGKVVDDYADTPWLAEALYLKGLASEKTRKFQEARSAWDRLVRELPGTHWAGRAKDRLESLPKGP